MKFPLEAVPYSGGAWIRDANGEDLADLEDRQDDHGNYYPPGDVKAQKGYDVALQMVEIINILPLLKRWDTASLMTTEVPNATREDHKELDAAHEPQR